jgi:hypothetical protein
MSWELTIKATTSKYAKVVWPSMKKLIDRFFESNTEYRVDELRNFLIDNLDAQVRKDNLDMPKNQQSAIIGQGLKDLKNDATQHSKFMDQKIPRYIRAKYNRARIHNTFNRDYYVDIGESSSPNFATMEAHRAQQQQLSAQAEQEKSSNSTFKRNIYKAYKEAIKNYYKLNDLGNFTLDELHSQSKDYAYEYLLNHPNINSRAVNSWLSAKSKKILPNILTALEREGVIKRLNKKNIEGVYKSWDSTLKAGQSRSASRKLIEQTIKEMLEEFLEGKDEVSTPQIKQYIIDNLKEEHIKRHNVDGKVTSAISSAPKRYINNRLDSHIKNKIPIMVKKLGYENKYTASFQGSERLIGGGHSYFIKKSESWESMTDSMIAEGKLFEDIYTTILRKYKFSSPSKDKVISYLNANYKRHPLFSNKWHTKGEGE